MSSQFELNMNEQKGKRKNNEIMKNKESCFLRNWLTKEYCPFKEQGYSPSEPGISHTT